MKKIHLIAIFSSLILLSLYFSLNIFLKKHFNEEYYYTPNFSGITLKDAQTLAKKSPVNVIFVSEEFSELPSGQIFSQEPKANAVVKKGRTIRVWTSKGTQDRIIPDVAGLSLIDAKSLVESRGFNLGETSVVSASLPAGTVIATDPEVGLTVSKELPVSFLVSDSTLSSYTKMPDLLGLTLDDAKVVLKDNSLLMGTISYEKVPDMEPGIVVKTNIDFNTNVLTGSAINLVVSK